MSIVLETMDLGNKIYCTCELGFINLGKMQSWTEFLDHRGYKMNNLVVIHNQSMAVYRIREEGVKQRFEEQFGVDTENCEVSDILCFCTEALDLSIRGKKVPITIYKGTVNVL